MAPLDKKERELAVATHYLKLRGIAAELEAHERPDVIARIDGRQIGIEVTEYHQPRNPGEKYPRRQVEAAWVALKEAVAEYRKHTRELDNLSVWIAFGELAVPGKRDQQEFIAAVHNAIRPRLHEQKFVIRVGDGDAAPLRAYVRKIVVRRVSCYMEWEWNHSVAGVGTSDEELAALIAPKLGIGRDQLHELHLVIAGDGPSGATYIGMLPAEWLAGYEVVNAMLGTSNYDAVAILNYRESVLWSRDTGWTDLHHAVDE